MPDILLKNKDGEDVTYSGIETVTFDTPTQEKGATFTYGTAVENVPIELDLADGNQKVTLPDGELAKSAIIQKPSELSPENIKIGVEIAGVEGEFIGNGVSKTVDLDFLDDSQFTIVDNESEFDALRMEASNTGRYIKFIGETGKYIKNAYYEIVSSEPFDASECKTKGSSTLGTTTFTDIKDITCDIGDMILAVVRSTSTSFALWEGWNLLYSGPDASELTGNSSAYGSNRIHVAYRFAIQEKERFRIDYDESSSSDVCIVTFKNALSCSAFELEHTKSTGANSITCTRKPSEVLAWAVISDKGTPQNWTASSGVRVIASSLYDYMAVGVDNTTNTDITFSFTNNDSSKSNIIMALPIAINIASCGAKKIRNENTLECQSIIADENTLMETVVVNKPDTLISENIIDGINIAGVVGTYKAPKLEPPTSIKFTKNSDTNLYRLGVAYPQFKNGQFGKKAQVLLVDENDEYEIVAEADIPVNTSQTSTTPYAYVYANDFFCGKPISGKRIAKFVGDVVAPSDVYKADTDYSLGHLKYNLGNVTVEPEYEYGFYDDALSMNIVPEDGYHLPKTIRLETPSGEITTDYTYDYDTGELVVSPKQPETISVNISAVDTPWLRTPYLYTNNPYKMSDPYLKYTYIDPNATNTTVSLNGETILENLNDTRTGLIEKSYSAVSGASYGFSFDGTYYKSGNSSIGTAALCQVNLNMKTAGTITITYVNYGYSSYDYGIIGKVDAVLSTSYNSDIDTSSTKVYTTFKSNNSTSVKTLTMSVPAGEHFIQFKYRRYSSSSNSYYFKFYVSTEATPSPSWSLANYITNYGSYPLQIQSFADGYTDSDISSVNIECRPTISVSNGNLSLSNTIDGVTDIELYVDDELATTIPYVDGMTIDVEEYAKELNIDRHSIHNVSVSAIGEGVASNKSNTLKMYLGTEPVYGVSGLYSSTVALTRLDDSVDMTYTVNSNGTVTSDFDNVFPWNEAKIVYDEYNNKFIQMPRMYFSVTTSSSYVSSVKVSKHPHSSGSWYKVDPFCYGCYGGYLNGTKLESKSGKGRTSQKTRANFRSYASANGDKYHQLDLYHSTVMKFLWWIEFATKDSVSVMSGRISGSGTSGGSSSRATGGTDKITTPSGYETMYKQMRWHYIEDFVGNFMELIDGVCLGYRNSSSSYGNSYVTSDYTKYSDSKTDMSTYPYLYTLSGTTLVKGYWWNSSLPFLCLPDGGTTATTTYTTYFCDSMYIATSSTNPIMYGGATYYYNTNSYGLSYMTSTSASTAPSYTGARLLYRGALDDVAYEQTLSGTKLTVNGFDSITQTETGIEVE